MSRVLTTTLVAVASSLTTSAWPQYLQSYPFGSGIQAGANTSQTAGANTAWTAGPTPYLGNAGGQYYSQPLYSAPYGIGTATGRFYQTFGSVAPGYVISSTPWFSSVALREQLALNELQYQNLYGAYVDAYARYNQAVAAIPASMAIAERAGQLQALEEVFNSEFNTALEANLTDPQLLQQFNNLRQQHQRQAPAPSNASNQLALTDEQHRRLSLMSRQWNQLAAQLRARAAADETVPPEEVTKLNSEAQKQIESTLTPEQQQIWPKLVGQYYDLDAPSAPPQSATPPNSGESQPAAAQQ